MTPDEELRELRFRVDLLIKNRDEAEANAARWLNHWHSAANAADCARLDRDALRTALTDLVNDLTDRWDDEHMMPGMLDCVTKAREILKATDTTADQPGERHAE